MNVMIPNRLSVGQPLSLHQLNASVWLAKYQPKKRACGAIAQLVGGFARGRPIPKIPQRAAGLTRRWFPKFRILLQPSENFGRAAGKNNRAAGWLT